MDEQNNEEITLEEVTLDTSQESQQTAEPEPVAAPSYADSLKALRDEFTKELDAQRVRYEAEIKERDEVIKQIMTEPSAPASVPQEDPIVAKINAKRHFIKW